MPTVSLSEHFSLDEMIATQHRGIDNAPPVEAVANLRQLAALLEVVRERLGGKPILITSGYRCWLLNQAVGGVPNSQHLLGQAADFICPSFGSPREIWEALKNSDVAYDQLIYEHPSTPPWCHVSWSANPRRQAFELGSA